MRFLFPRWVRNLPYAEIVTPTFALAVVVCVVGVIVLAVGVVLASWEMIASGILALFPFGLYIFMLWRTYKDDGYER